jgi:hypothetical protein
MAEDFGNGVTRTLSALARQFTSVVWQAGKPPLDSELNLMGQIDFESLRSTVHSQVHSGFFRDPCRPQDFRFLPGWSNHFYMGSGSSPSDIGYAAVNGMVIPVSGAWTSEVNSRIRLNPPPQTDSRTDLVFLEVWRTLVAPNPSVENKPAAGYVHMYGNTEFGGSNIPDDIEDPAIGFETTERVQVQYRIRVYGSMGASGESAALDLYPDGLEDPGILAQGAAAAPQAGLWFSNMRTELGDPGLWRAGAGDDASRDLLKTVDGYVYAIPICAVFRRNSSPYKAIMPSGGTPDHNGGPDRNPGALLLSDPRNGAVPLTLAHLSNKLDPSAIGSVDVANLVGSGFDASGFIPVDGSRFLSFGKGAGTEIIEVSAVTAGGSPGSVTIAERARGGTAAKMHPAGTPVVLYNSRPDHLYSDQITGGDVLDLRRSINFGDWDFHRILLHNVAALAKGSLRTTWKQNGAMSGSQGPVLHAIDYMWADGTGTPSDLPVGTDVIDGPDGVRTTWSDAAVMETATVLLDNEDQQLENNHEVASTSPWNDQTSWNVGAPFVPTGFMNNSTTNGWKNGSVIKLHIGGLNGTSGARGTFRSDEKAVRFVSPREMWRTGYPTVAKSNGQQHPVRIRFLKEKAHEPAHQGTGTTNTLANHPGPMYPWRDTDFEYPFLVLGGLAWGGGYVTGLIPDQTLYDDGNFQEVDLGVNWSEAGVFFPVGADLTYASTGTPLTELMDPTLVTTPMVRGERTVWDLITGGGADFSGASSELYLVLYGDEENESNNGAFRVTGLGTTGATRWSGTTNTRVVVQPLSADFNGFVMTANTTQKAEIRTQWTNSEDGEGAGGKSALCIVLTDIECGFGKDNPWGQASDNPVEVPVASKMVITTTLLYHPGRGGTTRVADDIHRFSVVDGGGSYLRNNVSDIDPNFSEDTSFPEAERHWKTTHIQLWNRLPGLGWDAPYAPKYGGRTVLDSESQRESELFVDKGSKTVMFRPFQQRLMTLQAHKFTDAATGSHCMLNSFTYLNGDPRDGAGIWTPSLDTAFALPPEYMPRLGRQDIPHHTMTSAADEFLPGINHLFCDETDETSEVFCIIGGEDNQGAPGNHEVTPMLFQTGNSGTPQDGQSATGYAYCEHGDVGGVTGHPAYQARLSSFSDVISSDLGHGMTGIELPPNIGVARVYGVYERQEYLSQMDQNIPGMHKAADRVTPLDGSPATNLIRTDSDRQTLFIREDGGFDVTGEKGDHTYVIPSEAIDHTLAANYDPTKSNFSDYNYVVETVVFGFATGFITQHNWVLARKTAGTGILVSDMSAGTPELESVQMVFPCAADINDKAYIAYSRTPYQGDPFMTRDGTDLNTLDFQHRYGQVGLDDSRVAGIDRAQFDLDGSMLTQRPNPRAFEVLASLDFYTTMGTGKIGGSMTPGNILDVGFIDPTEASTTRVHSQDDVDQGRRWRVVPRAFSEGQKGNTSRASAEITVLAGAPAIFADPAVSLFIRITAIDGSVTLLKGNNAGGADFVLGATQEEFADNLAAAVNTHAGLTRVCTASSGSTATCRFESVQTGSVGNGIRIKMLWVNAAAVNTSADVSDYLELVVDRSNSRNVKNIHAAYFTGGEDQSMNAGAGASQLNLTGMTERLPLGILLQDSDFLCENPLGLNASAFKTSPAGVRPIQSVLPMTEGGEEYERFLGSPGDLVAMCDGVIKWYAPHNGDPASTGTRKFRIYRGGGAAFVLSGKVPGGPLDWVSETLTAPLEPVLKGGALACKALLVRNFPEDAFGSGYSERKRSDGDEIQMFVVTHGILPPDRAASGVTLGGIISPTGFGEGMSSSDRYLVRGRPLIKARRPDVPDPSVDPAPYPGDEV